LITKNRKKICKKYKIDKSKIYKCYFYIFYYKNGKIRFCLVDLQIIFLFTNQIFILNNIPDLKCGKVHKYVFHYEFFWKNH
jgi:hypothetical protein